MRFGLVVTGFVLIALAPVVGVLPGPGGIVVFAIGASLALKNSRWVKKRYAEFKKRHPRYGDWADWGLRRQSAKRRAEIARQDVAESD
ncbi:hypothetical protein D3876_12285 [Sphingomonas cavernae]|uniref:Uncharacterized protein n=1 Tax=Sphingomonas cavernae TaxID=2320861 RepID=A0A418WNI9_9SPHN|nr:hypothetical protein D3876_12285 [Sphingomonas cavernae]